MAMAPARQVAPVGYKEIATSSTNVTYANALTELQTAWNNLTDLEKSSARIKRGSAIFGTISIGVFERITLDGNYLPNYYQLGIGSAKYFEGKLDGSAIPEKGATTSVGTSPLILETLVSE